MDRIDRRTFLTTGMKAGAALAAAGVVSDAAVQGVSADASTAPSGSSPDRAPGRPTLLSTTGVADPVGVDPDEVQFAWRVADGRRGAVQGAYRIVVSGPDGPMWDSSAVHSAQQSFVPYAGPALVADTRYRWTVRTADASGVWGEPSAPSTFATGLRSGDWAAVWLRPGPLDPGMEEYTYLRTVRALPPGAITRATAFIAAAHKYRLWVNGTQLDSGPSFCFPDEQYYQATDVTSAVAAGRRNAFGVLHHWYGPGRGRPASAPGLLVQVSVHYAGGRVVTIGSDGAWRSSPAEWLPAPQRNNDAGDFVEWIDARRAPMGWSEPGFDDHEWTPTAVRGPVGTPPFTRLYAQRTRIDEQEVEAVSIRTLPTGSVVADFGRIYAGRPTVAFRSGVDGRTVPMHVGYTLDPDGAASTIHNTQGTDLSFSYIQRSGAQSFVPYTYLGFRYLQIDNPGELIGRDQVTLLTRHATLPDLTPATFTSSEPLLDSVWDLCAHSAQYTSQEQFIDTPTREKGQFLWDASNESQTVMRAFGEHNLSWQGLRDQARAQARYWPDTGQVNEIYPNDDGASNYPLFTAIYPEWVWRYFLSTGDRATLASLYPTLLRLSDYLAGTEDPSTGLISGQPMSTNGDSQYGYDYSTNADTTLNILAVNAFRRIAATASMLGEESAAAAQRQRAAALEDAVNGRVVNAAGVYVDGLRTDGQQSTVASQLANVVALAYDVVPAARVPTVAAHVASLDISVEPDHGMELLRALHAGGRTADVVRLLTDASFPGWAAIIKAGGTFTWETWTPSDLVGDSMSHGWGSSALVAIQEALLGAVPEPAPAEGPPTQVAITAPAAGLSRASGTFPTPAGEYSVAWRTSSAGTRLSVAVPANAGAHVRLPGASVSQVTEGGVALDRAPGVRLVSTEGSVVVAVGAGRYEFTVSAH
jgi:alpha-L-rhamnosidase